MLLLTLISANQQENILSEMNKSEYIQYCMASEIIIHFALFWGYVSEILNLLEMRKNISEEMIRTTSLVKFK